MVQKTCFFTNTFKNTCTCSKIIQFVILDIMAVREFCRQIFSGQLRFSDDNPVTVFYIGRDGKYGHVSMRWWTQFADKHIKPRMAQAMKEDAKLEKAKLRI